MTTRRSFIKMILTAIAALPFMRFLKEDEPEQETLLGLPIEHVEMEEDASSIVLGESEGGYLVSPPMAEEILWIVDHRVAYFGYDWTTGKTKYYLADGTEIQRGGE